MGRVAPDVSGDHSATLAPVLGTANSGDMAGDYSAFGFGFKTALNDKIDLAFVVDSPIGADVDYKAGTGYIYGGSTASIDSTALTLLARYKLPSNFSVHGGLRFQRAEGEVALFNGYTMNTDTASDTGFVVGAAWEKPEIAARIALTYNSAITHKFNATENIAAVTTVPVPTGALVHGSNVLAVSLHTAPGSGTAEVFLAGPSS